MTNGYTDTTMKRNRPRLSAVVLLFSLLLSPAGCSGLVSLFDDGATDTVTQCDDAVLSVVSTSIAQTPPLTTLTAEWRSVAATGLDEVVGRLCADSTVVVVLPQGIQELALLSGPAATATSVLTDAAGRGAALDDLFRIEIAAYQQAFPDLRDTDVLRTLALTHASRSALSRLARVLSALRPSIMLAVPVIEADIVRASTEPADAALYASAVAPDGLTVYVAASSETVQRTLLLDSRGQVVATTELQGIQSVPADSFLRASRSIPAGGPLAPLAIPVTGNGIVEATALLAESLLDPVANAKLRDDGGALWLVHAPLTAWSGAVSEVSWMPNVLQAFAADRGPVLAAFGLFSETEDVADLILSPEDVSLLADGQGGRSGTGSAPAMTSSAVDLSASWQAASIPESRLPTTAGNALQSAVELDTAIDASGRLVLLWSSAADGVEHLYADVYPSGNSSAARIDNRIGVQHAPRLFRSGDELYAAWLETIAGTPRIRLARWLSEQEAFTSSSALVTRTTAQDRLVGASGNPAFLVWVETALDEQQVHLAGIDVAGVVSDTVLASVSAATATILETALAVRDSRIAVAWLEAAADAISAVVVTSQDSGQTFAPPLTMATFPITVAVDHLQVAWIQDEVALYWKTRVVGRDELHFQVGATEGTLADAPLIAQFEIRQDADDATARAYWLEAVDGGWMIMHAEPETDLLASTPLLSTSAPLRSLRVARQQDGALYTTAVSVETTVSAPFIRTDLR